MANYYYDGSFDGLLTVIYMAYEDRENKMLRVNANTEQLILSLEGIHIATDFSKARRVEKAICEKLSYEALDSSTRRVLVVSSSRKVFQSFEYSISSSLHSISRDSTKKISAFSPS